MVNILLEGLEMNSEYLYEELRNYIRPYHRVVNVAFSFRDTQARCLDEWNTLYSRENGIFYDNIMRSFANFGIPDENVVYINYFSDTKESAADKIRNADIVYFPSGLPDKMMERICEFELEDVLLKHDGVIMGFSAGALIQLAEYDLSPDKDCPEFGYYNGLPFLRIFTLKYIMKG